MPPIRPTSATALEHIQVMWTDDGSRTLCDTRLGETYHSGCGALAESWHVYVKNSGVAARLSCLVASETPRTIRVLEYGFGTGMAWLLTASWAAFHGSSLEYVALENALLPHAVLQELRQGEAIQACIEKGLLPSELKNAALLEQRWLEFRKASASEESTELELDLSNHQRNPGAVNHFRLVLGDAAMYPDPSATMEPFDAIYFDAFSPATNPNLWSELVFRRAASVLREGGVLVSYCVKGDVRRALMAAGFDVARVAGPEGGKREVLVARLVRAMER